jgi:hypothetical protein
VTTRGVDYAWGRPSVESIKAAGASFACRYLAWLPNGKCLDRTEANRLRAGGIDIVSNWEYYGNWENDYSGGYNNGVIHAQEAQKQHVACGGPPNRPIYFSTDFNPADGQLPTIADYYRGVASVIGLSRTGAYGGYRTIKYLFDAGVIRWGWQTYAWSGSPTVWDGRAQLRQIKNGVIVGGVDSDLNDAMVSDWGQWSEGELMATASDVIMAWSQGMTKTPDGTLVAPVVWRIRDETWMGAINTTIVALRAAAETRDAATLAAITTLAEIVLTGGGNVDTAAIVAAIEQATAAAATVAAEQAERVNALQRELDQVREALRVVATGAAEGLADRE